VRFRINGQTRPARMKDQIESCEGHAWPENE
jgi:hypothetical protein